MTIKKLCSLARGRKLVYPSINSPLPPPYGCSPLTTFLDSFYVIQQGPSNNKTNQTAFVVKLIKSEQHEDGDIFSLCCFS